MEMLVGGTLREELNARRTLPLRDILVIGIQLFDGLADAHRLGVVHRDIKPENLFLNAGDEPRLLRILDFGIAKVFSPQGSGPAPRAQATGMGFMVGSLRWTAPETIEGGPIDGRTDIYSAGLVLYCLATGQLPFSEATSQAALSLAHIREPLPLASQIANVPGLALLDPIIARATAKASADRWANASDVSEALRDVLRRQFAVDLPRVALGSTPRLVPWAAPRAAERSVHGALFPELAPGTIFERRYEIVSHLGHGGMGTVYRAKHAFLGRDIALKLIPLDVKSMSADVRRQFANEMQVLAKLDHPNIVRIYDGGVTDGDIAYIVMELLPGESLRRHLRLGRPLDDALTCSYLGQIAAGLAALHAVPILHRDIKPDNVIVQRDGVVKIVDFGLARVRTTSKYATQNPSAMGTLHYMPREQLMNEPLDESVDVYALGLMMFECFVGMHPRSTATGEFQNVREAIASVIEGRPLEPLDRRRPDLPRAIVSLFGQCTANLPHDRPKAREIVVAVAAFAASLGRSTASQAVGQGAVPGLSAGAAPAFPPARPLDSAPTERDAVPRGGSSPGFGASANGGAPSSIASQASGFGGVASGAVYQSGLPSGLPAGTVASAPMAVASNANGAMFGPTATGPSVVVPVEKTRRRGGLTIVISVVFLSLTAALVIELVRPGTLLPGSARSAPATSTAVASTKRAPMIASSGAEPALSVAPLAVASTPGIATTAPSAAPSGPAPSSAPTSEMPVVNPPDVPRPPPARVPAVPSTAQQHKPGFVDSWPTK